MNLLKSILGWSENAAPKLQAEGTFYIEKAGTWTCLYNAARADLENGRESFTAILKITREDEGDADYDLPPEMTFPLHQGMDLAKEIGPLERAAFSWTFTSDEFGVATRYLFEFDREDDFVELFEARLRYSMYEAIYERSAVDASPDDLRAILLPREPAVRHAEAQLHTPIKSTSSSSVPHTPATPAMTPDSLSPSSIELMRSPLPPPPVEQKRQGKCVGNYAADFFRYSASTGTFLLIESQVQVAVNNTVHSKEAITYYLYILQSGVITLAQQVGSDMHIYFDETHKSVVWAYVHEGVTHTFSLVFHDEQVNEDFKQDISKFLWETNTATPFAKVAKNDVDWILGAYADEVDGMEEDDGIQEFDKMEFVEEKPETAGDKHEEEEEEEEEEQPEEEEDSDDEEEEVSEQDKNAKNSALAVGYKYDRSFVVRGSQIGVFKHTPDNRLKFSTTIKNVKTPSGQRFQPRKLMLHNEDENLLLLHPTEQNKVFKMDLTRGDVVEEWKTAREYPIKEVCPETKYAQTTSTPTLMGLNGQSFYRLDPRLPGEKQVSSRSYMYGKSAPALSCMATTENGHMVMGSRKGEIRLFSDKTFSRDIDPLARLKPRAKTTLPGLGDPIIGIDVTADGKWILATCRNYLLVASTALERGTTGFESTMGKEKPVPRILRLKPEHVELMEGKVSFTPARFNVGESDEERSIVTSTGPYIITWNFRKVKQNKLLEYTMKKYGDIVVADHFRYNQETAVVVALPNNVTMARKDVVKKLF